MAYVSYGRGVDFPFKYVITTFHVGSQKFFEISGYTKQFTDPTNGVEVEETVGVDAEGNPVKEKIKYAVAKIISRGHFKYISPTDGPIEYGEITSFDIATSNTIDISVRGISLDPISMLGYTGSADVEGLLRYTMQGNDTVVGSQFDDYLFGGTGVDIMLGGLGNDSYEIDNIGDVVIEKAGEGIDTVRSYADFTIGQNIESLILVGDKAAKGYGNDADNYIQGNDYANVLAGGAGNDYLAGAGGNDTIYGGDGNDVIHAGYGEYSGVAEADRVSVGNNSLFGGNGNDWLFGGVGNDALYGQAGNDYLSGADGNDVLVGGQGNDTLFGGVGNDILFASEGNNSVYGDAGHDALFGSVGDDILDGGDGFDWIYYTQATAGVVLDLSLNTAQNTVGAGSDTVTNAEAIRGSVFGDILLGNAQANILQGWDGDDQLWGMDGNDTFYGGFGNDFMDGGDGTDTLIYVQASSGVSIDLSLNTAPQLIYGSKWDFVRNVENVYGSLYDDLVAGDAGANMLGGGTGGNDTLNGGLGADTMIGGIGDDTYFVDDAGDVVTEWYNQGNDTVRSTITYTLGDNVENLVLTESADINGLGNFLANRITGNDGNNSISGGAGNDTLTGGAGADSFVFDSMPSPLNVDLVADFTQGEDRIVLDNDIFVTLGLTDAALTDDKFRSAAGATSALTAEQRIILNTANGSLYYDADGSGAGASVQIATLQGTGIASITAADFFVVD